MGCCCGDDREDEKVDITSGPIKNRGCTDIICCITYLAFIGFWIAIAAVAFKDGNPIQILLPTDSSGNLCGDGAKITEKYLMYFDVTKCGNIGDLATSNLQCPTYQKCVETCPDEYWSYYSNAFPQILTYSNGLALAPTTPFSTIICGNDNNVVGDLCVDMEKFICKPQFESRLTQMVDGTIPPADVLETFSDLVTNGDCASYYFPSRPTLKRCLPALPTNANETDADLVNNNITINEGGEFVTFEEIDNGLGGLIQTEAEDFFRTSVADLKNTWPMILIVLGMALVVSFLWILAMRWIAAPMIWIFIFGLIGVLTFGVYYTYTQYETLKTKNIQVADLAGQFTVDFAAYLQSYEIWLGFCIAVSILLCIVLLLLLFFCKRIRIATRLIGEASKAVGSIMSTLFFPLITGILYILVILWWAATSTYIATSASPIFQIYSETNQTFSEECNITEWDDPSHEEFNNSEVVCLFTKYQGDYGWTNDTIVVQLVNLFGFYWSMNFITALGQMTLAGAFASWYFAFKKPQDVPTFALTAAFFRSFYHFGTMAFGALIIAIIQILRSILNYIERKTERYSNTVTKILLCCCKCCLWCLEKCLRYISKNAYILTAIYGYSFCKSSCKAVKLIISNAARAAALGATTAIMLFIGKLLVACGCAAFTWAFFSKQFVVEESWLQLINVDPDAVNSVWLPTLIVFIGSYLIAMGFFNVYGMAVDTIFMCFLEDLERNDGTPQKPYFMSKSLMKLLGKKNRKQKKDKETSSM